MTASPPPPPSRTKPSAADIRRWLVAKTIWIAGKLVSEKVIAIAVTIGISALMAFFMFPCESWLLQEGTLIVDCKEYRLAEGQAKLIWPRKFLPWEQFQIVGLPGGDITFDADAGLPEDLTVTQLRCSDHRGCLADEAAVNKVRRNTLHIVAQSGSNGDSWSLVFCSKKRFAEMMRMKKEVSDLEQRIVTLTRPQFSPFQEREWVSNDGKRKVTGTFHCLDGDTITILDRNGKPFGGHLNKLSDNCQTFARDAETSRTIYEERLAAWKRESDLLTIRLAMLRRKLAAEGVSLPAISVPSINTASN